MNETKKSTSKTTRASKAEEAAAQVKEDTQPIPLSKLPTVAPMTKTEAYALIKRSREGLRDADNHIWKGNPAEVQEALLETITCATHVLDALKHQGIKGLEKS